jgi:hypothetical protein
VARAEESEEFLGQRDDDVGRASHVAKPVLVLVLDHLADKLGAVGAQASDRVVDAFDRKHDASEAQRVRRCDRRLDLDQLRVAKLRQLKPPVAIRGSHHDDVDLDTFDPVDAVHPRALHRRFPFDRHAEGGEKSDRGGKVIDDDADVVQSLDGHVPTIAEAERAVQADRARRKARCLQLTRHRLDCTTGIRQVTPPTLCPGSSVSDLLYELNARDELSSVNAEWLRFALANGGEPLDPAQILGRPLWDFIGDMETQHIYRLLHRRVRAGGEPVRLCFRCDAPDRRRLLDLEISAGPEDGLIYRVRTLREQEREPMALLEPSPPRSEHFVTICAWCERVAVPAHGWLEIEAAIGVLPVLAEPRPPQLTHGICGVCAQALHGALGEEPVSAVLGQL